MKTPQQGYIALMSAIIISAVLIAITLSLSFNGFFARINVADSESKSRSLALAEACVNAAILESAENRYSVNKTVLVGPAAADACTIISAQKNVPQAGQTTIKAQAAINKSYTNLKVIVNSTTFIPVSFEECETLSLCP